MSVYMQRNIRSHSQGSKCKVTLLCVVAPLANKARFYSVRCSQNRTCFKTLHTIQRQNTTDLLYISK